MEYKNAEEENAEGIAELLQKKYGGHYEPVQFTPDFVKERLARKNVFYVIAIDENKIVGTVRATIIDLDLAELRHEVFPNQETGKRLIEKTLEILKSQKSGIFGTRKTEKKMRKVIARAVSTDEINNEIYKQLGWVQEGLFKDHYRKGTDIIQYAKFL